ncbi:titin homolog [Trichoplusia ni]|uniref:Titin homolog n=1 Tax=Trichoplusia ni TaxID=7111 RepID=A0A7E5WB68_TRINI|nr:titin homolog [Trichoplusia ni]XP_026737677.1 titin homolog [Trichoplusia ni]
MDRLSHLRGEAGSSRDSTLDTTSPPSESFMTANESNSKYYSLSEVDSTFDISSIKDVSMGSATTGSDETITNTDELISNLSPIGKKSDILDSYKIGKQIEAANILSGGVDIFDDNDNSYDGDELVIDDAVDVDDKSNSELKQVESMQYKSDENESTLMNEDVDIASKDTEVVLQIDGKNVDAIDIGNGLYLYRKEGQEELAAVQIIDDDQQQPSFKFLKVRENAEGNLEVYEEIEIEVPKEVPAKEGKTPDKKISSHVPIKDINKVISDTSCNKVAERKRTPRKEPKATVTEVETEISKELSPDNKSEVNFNGKMMKFNESRKSPVIGSFTPMTFHSTPNKEGIPLTKTMVDQQLHPNRHSDNIKKTIEVHTDSCKQRPIDSLSKFKDADDNKINDISSTEKEIDLDETNEKDINIEESIAKDDIVEVNDKRNEETAVFEEAGQLIIEEDSDSLRIIQSESNESDKKEIVEKCVPKDTLVVAVEQDNVIDSTESNSNKSPLVLQDVQAETVDEIKENTENESAVVATEKPAESVLSEKTETTNIESEPDSGKAEVAAVETVIVETETEQQTKENEVIEIIEDDSKDAMEIDIQETIEEKAEKVDESDKEKITIVDKTNESEQKAKVCEKINEPQSKEADDIIIIDDSVAEESVVEESIKPETQKIVTEITVSERNAMESSTKINVEEKGKAKEKIVSKNAVPQEPESVQDKDLKLEESTKKNDVKNESKDTEPKATPETEKEKVVEVASDSVKNSQSKIPVPQPTKDTNKPTESELTSKTESSKPMESSEKVDKPKDIPKETVQEKIVEPVQSIPLDLEPTLNKKTESPKHIPIELIKPQGKLKAKSKNVEKSTLIPTKAALVKPLKQEVMKENAQDKCNKKEPEKSTKVLEPPKSAVPTKVESIDVTQVAKTDDVAKEPAVTEKEKTITQEKPEPVPNVVADSTVHKEEQKDNSLPSTSADSETVKSEGVVNKSSIEEPMPCSSSKPDVCSSSSDVKEDAKPDTSDRSEPGTSGESKPKNNAAVPFGKWTATNRKEFLDKIKTRVPQPAPQSTSNQLKNSNDLNRRDVLKKIDSQRQSSNALSKSQEANKQNVKNETAFGKTNLINKDNSTQESKIPLKVETEPETNAVVAKTTAKKEEAEPSKTQNEPSQAAVTTNVPKKEASERTEVNYQHLIDKTIEGMIHRTVAQKSSSDEPNQNSTKDESAPESAKYALNYEPTDQATLDAIEMKMNELHGIPFIERPPHELPQVPITEVKPVTKTDTEKQPAPVKASKIPNLLPFTNKNQQWVIKGNVVEVDSEEEIIEHEPITGDKDLTKKTTGHKHTIKEKLLNSVTADAAKKEAIITENEFDKFARRNSITYENCLTVNFDGKEAHKVIQNVVEKDPYPKSYSRNDIARNDPKSRLTYKYQNMRQNTAPVKVHQSNKFGTATEDSSNRNHSKLQKAYQSALTAKRQMECPITIIEDKPVKVVFMDNMEFVPSQLNVQGQELSPAKKREIEADNVTVSTVDSLELDVLDNTDDSKSQDEVKIKTKHQRKQVFTPVDEPELELIEPKDLGLESSPKKKKKSDEDKTVKYPMRKKYYLLGSNTLTEEKVVNTAEVVKNPLKETVNRNDNGVSHKNAVSAIDSLVKAAELLEHQSENFNLSDSPNPDSQNSTPVKRGRGRPRKYPLPDGGMEKQKISPSPQKKPRLIDAKPPPRDTSTEDESDSDEIIKENWTMGKINENIVCPICSKLFRTENVVFKHVKHCTGPSPNRSDSDKRSPRRSRHSQESDSKSRDESQSDDMDDDEPLIVRKTTPKKRKSKDSVVKSDDKDDVIIIEDTPVKEKPEKKDKEVDERKHHESRKPKPDSKQNNLVCEFCGKTFRQLSYLVKHKLQHKKEEVKKIEKEPPINHKSVYSCEVCKKQFRKLHHLVQHRIIHNPSSVPARTLRKSSSEQNNYEKKVEKDPSTSAAKQNDDPSAGFRCEPCDKSFRKLHHLVEHRETHDGINRQKTTVVTQNSVEKPVLLHHCDICKKTFNKLQLLIEHKEQHVETSSEKSDDKSVKSSLSTKDIIHECPHCYKVFPNEHSLTKHTTVCQRKKRQSKQDTPAEKPEDVEPITETTAPKTEEKVEDDLDSSVLVIDETKNVVEKPVVVKTIEMPQKQPEAAKVIPQPIVPRTEKVKEIVPVKVETKPPQIVPAKREFEETQNTKIEAKSEVPEKIKKVDVKENPKVIPETPKKKTVLKEKSTASASKRKSQVAQAAVKPAPAPAPPAEDVKPSIESSDDDEVRYMLNPNFKVEDTTEEKVFMKVKAKKRSSLQIERPNSKDLVKRRTSLQHPPKIPRLKPKAVETNSVTVKNIVKAQKLEPIASTDSDDSETVKYSFPKTVPEKTTKPAQDRTSKELERKTQKNSVVDKRKSLSAIAKRKSLGKAVVPRHKVSPVKQIKRRTLEVEHRCDCGQLFSSAALLSRHTTLAHTPPRIRRRRSPPPDDKPAAKSLPRKSCRRKT